MSNFSILSTRPRKESQEWLAPYQYEALPDYNIRLLRLLPPRSKGFEDAIECEIFQTPLKNAKSFSALSYAWGNQEQERTLKVKSSSKLGRGKHTSIPITPNLFNALKYLRHQKLPVWLWADQVCINQKDIQERNAQVNIMRAIYEKAERTVVWLGDEDADTEVLKSMFETLKRDGPQPEATRPGASDGRQGPNPLRVLDQELLKKLLQGEGRPDGSSLSRREVLIRFLGRNWFRRAWVYQEAVVAVKVEMVWGSLRLPFDFVAGLILSSYSIFKSEDDGKWYQLLKKTKGFGPLRSIWFDRQEKKTVEKKIEKKTIEETEVKEKKMRDRETMGFLHILWRARKYLDASDHRDLVYSFLGFYDFRPEFQLRADYSVTMDSPKYACSVEDTFVGLARATIASSGSLHIFRCIAPTKSSRYNLPSWVPNWAERRFRCGSPIVLPGVANGFNACLGRHHNFVAGNPRHLLVQGHHIAHILSVIDYKIDHCYYHSRVSDAIGLKQLALQAFEESQLLEAGWPSKLSAGFRQYNGHEELQKVLLRVILADGAFSSSQPIEFSIEDLLRVHNDFAALSEVKDLKDHTLYQYIRQAGSVAQGKKVFLTDRLELGLGYSNVKCGDIVCLIYGSNTPCILRKSSTMAPDCYKLVGQCYLNGWMYGENAWDMNWWEQEATVFTLV